MVGSGLECEQEDFDDGHSEHNDVYGQCHRELNKDALMATIPCFDERLVATYSSQEIYGVLSKEEGNSTKVQATT
jgi:hypothetical protein